MNTPIITPSTAMSAEEFLRRRADFPDPPVLETEGKYRSDVVQTVNETMSDMVQDLGHMATRVVARLDKAGIEPDTTIELYKAQKREHASEVIARGWELWKNEADGRGWCLLPDVRIMRFWKNRDRAEVSNNVLPVPIIDFRSGELAYGVTRQRSACGADRDEARALLQICGVEPVPSDAIVGWLLPDLSESVATSRAIESWRNLFTLYIERKGI